MAGRLVLDNPMKSQPLKFDKFRLRIMPCWHTVTPAADLELLLRHDEVVDREFAISLCAAAPEKVFADAEGKCLWDAPELLLRLATRSLKLMGCSELFDMELYRKSLTWGAVSARFVNSFIRQWFVAGDSAIAIITFRRSWDEQSTGVECCLPMVQSFRWARSWSKV